ncbi:unnamed protein product [Caenorhabditis bovis]|uniref:GATA-type domain-containing protein n=1 Tax=Caenorhabditis bovis TaxID=2654633 RepID=A0A8S1EMS5_9PELO|nr:unnamed protein product [Caenorhabditis bovis]
MMNSPLTYETFYTNSPFSSATDTSESLVHTPSSGEEHTPPHCNKNELESVADRANHCGAYFAALDSQGRTANSQTRPPERFHSVGQTYPAVQDHTYQSPQHQNVYYCYPQGQQQQQQHLQRHPEATTSAGNPRLPAIDNFMKEIQVKEEFAEYYGAFTFPIVLLLPAPNQTMSEYRVEKVGNPLTDPYLHLEQPIYADFTNALNQQEVLNMNFQNNLASNYMGTQMAQPPTVQFNLFDLNLTNFHTFNQACDTAIPLMHQSPSHPTATTYGMGAHSNFTPPPQDPLVPEQKPIKKRMAAVQCHQNSICSNCKTRETTLWRRNGEGGVECNACNLYFRKNNRKRPLSLRKDGIMKRNRRPRNESPTGSLRRTGHTAAC